MRSHAGVMLLTVLAASALAGCETTYTASNDRAVADSTISANVKAALVQDPVTRASNISVNTLDGTVELSGFVNNRDQRHEAVADAGRIAGVRSVRDELQVNDQGEANEAVGAAYGDATITHRVQAALASSPQTESSNIEVSTSNGVVQLAGFVNSRDQRDAAGDVARSVQGVRDVDNDLRLSPP